MQGHKSIYSIRLLCFWLFILIDTKFTQVCNVIEFGVASLQSLILRRFNPFRETANFFFDTNRYLTRYKVCKKREKVLIIAITLSTSYCAYY